MRPGVYGKLPSQGDFVSRRLPWEFSSGWDDWLQAGLTAAKSRLGDAWLDRYLTAPIWRFQLAPGVLGAGGWVGLWFASVDRVGRHFPLTLAVPLPVNAVDRWVVLEADEAFVRWEDAALQALDPRLGFDAFDASLDELPPLFDDLPAAQTDVLGRCAEEPSTIHLPATITAGDALQVARSTGAVKSCFFSWGGEQLPPALCRTRALPDAESFHSFLDGDWAFAQHAPVAL